MSGNVGDAALVLGMFCLADPTIAGSQHGSDELLGVAWRASENLGITQPHQLGIATTPPPLPATRPKRSARGYSLLAARSQASGDRSLFESFVFQDSDVRGVLTLLSPNEGTAGPTWTELHSHWQAAWESAAAGHNLDALGTLRLADICIFAGTTAGEPQNGGGAELRELAGRARVLASGLDLEASSLAQPSADTVLFGRWQDDRRCRALVLSDVQQTGQLDGLVWPGHTDMLSPLLAYLLHAAKLRYACHRYDSQLCDELDRACRRVQADVTHLLAIDRVPVGSRSLEVKQLVNTHAQLNRELSESGGLPQQRTRVERLQLGAQVALVNMYTYLPAAERGPVGSLFDQDRSCASTLDEQVTYDLAVAALAERRARDVYEMTDLRLRQVANEQAGYQAWLTLLQSSIVGSLLAVLAALTALKTQISLSGLAEPALVASVGTTAIALPILIAGERRSETVREIALGTMVSAVAWLLVATIVNSISTRISSTWSLMGLAAGPIAALVRARLKAIHTRQGSGERAAHNSQVPLRPDVLGGESHLPPHDR